ncbi:serine/threonine-protein kinase [bacterium]|nr:serine/threonine-protein kinase [bacterium]
MIGRVIGPYEVVASIGRGGMGEVFKGRDTRLDRDVALKVLPAELARDPERLARFQREARVLASLQNQNIAAIYGLEEADGQPVLVMELALGDDLSARLRGGPLPADQIEGVARQLARGLEYAHEQGIVHRDLKPANVKVAPDGTVKILDFGLARAFKAEAVEEGDAESQSYQPTITQALTGSGAVLGTAAYMSPEQARGYEVDRRADIWAFGVILHEMMTGVRLFEGDTATDTLAAVLHKEPDWEALAADQPAMLVQICRRCLEKDARQRLRDIGEARVALEGSSSSIMSMTSSAAAAALPPPAAPPSARTGWVVAAALAVVAGLAAWAGLTGRIGPEPEPERLVQSAVEVPQGVVAGLAPIAPGPLRVSPDGRMLCYSGTDSLGVPQVYVRHLADGWTRPLNGTRGAVYPFWSADSREVGFSDGAGQILRVPVGGGPAVRVVPASNMKGGAWNQFDEILFAPTHAGSIWKVAATGGDPVDLTHIDRDEGIRSHRLPEWLPDGRHFIYIAVTRAEDNPDLDTFLRVADAETGESVDLMRVQSSAQYAEGHILYPHDGLLMARPFDPDRREFTGPARPVLDNVLMIRAAHLSAFSVSRNGVLAYVRASGSQGRFDIERYAATGESRGTIVRGLLTVGLAFAPDGRSLALAIPDERTGTMDMWQVEIERGLRTRLTFGTESEWGPVYHPGGAWMAVFADPTGHGGAYRVDVAGGGALAPLVVNDEDNYPGGFSPDGRRLYFAASDSSATFRLSVLDLESGEARRLHPNAQSGEAWPRVSPDGRWLAYVSQETGGQEVFIEGLGERPGRWRVSADGGNHPRWSPQGDVLYFVDGAQNLIGVAIEELPGGLRFGESRVLVTGIERVFNAPYDIDMASGDIAVMTASVGTGASAFPLVTGWTQLLERNRKD